MNRLARLPYEMPNEMPNEWDSYLAEGPSNPVPEGQNGLRYYLQHRPMNETVPSHAQVVEAARRLVNLPLNIGFGLYDIATEKAPRLAREGYDINWDRDRKELAVEDSFDVAGSLGFGSVGARAAGAMENPAAVAGNRLAANPTVTDDFIGHSGIRSASLADNGDNAFAPAPVRAQAAPEVAVLEPVHGAARFDLSTPWEMRSPHWPKSWFQEFHGDGVPVDIPKAQWDQNTLERAKLFVRDMELRERVNKIVEPLMWENGRYVRSRGEAERLAMADPATKQLLDDAYSAKQDFYEHANPNWQSDPYGPLNYPDLPGTIVDEKMNALFGGAHDNTWELPGGNGGADKGKTINYPKQRRKAGDTLFSNSDEAALPAAIPGAMVDDRITAYHGSPADFDQFKTPAFFMKEEGIARMYKSEGGGGDNLNGLSTANTTSTDYMKANSAFDKTLDRSAAANKLRTDAEKFEAGIKKDRWYNRIGPDDIRSNDFRKRMSSEARSAADYLDRGGPLGRMYEVRLPPPTRHYRNHGEDFPGGQAALLEQAKREGHKVVSLGGELVALDPSAIELVRKYYSNHDNAVLPSLPGTMVDDRNGITAYHESPQDIIEIVKKYGVATAVSLYGADAVMNATGDNESAYLNQQGY